MTEAGVEKKDTFPLSFEELTQAGVKPKKGSPKGIEPFVFKDGDKEYYIFHIKKEDERSGQFGGRDALLIFDDERKPVGAVAGERYTKWLDNNSSNDEGWSNVFLKSELIVDSKGKIYNIPNKEIALNVGSSYIIHSVRKDRILQMSDLIKQVNNQNFANSLQDMHIAKNIQIPVVSVIKGDSAQFCQSCHTIPNQPYASAKKVVGSLN